MLLRRVVSVAVLAAALTSACGSGATRAASVQAAPTSSPTATGVTSASPSVESYQCVTEEELDADGQPSPSLSPEQINEQCAQQHSEAAAQASHRRTPAANAVATPDPCTLLTAAEISAAFGLPVAQESGQPTMTARNEVPFGRMCSWDRTDVYPPAFPLVFSLTVLGDDLVGEGAPLAREAYDQVHRDEPVGVDPRFTTRNLPDIDPTAYQFAERTRALVHGIFISVQTVTTPDAASRALSISLLRTAIARLPG